MCFGSGSDQPQARAPHRLAVPDRSGLSRADPAERATDTASYQEARSHVLIEPEVAVREAASRSCLGWKAAGYCGTAWTFLACGPFWPCATSNSTLAPSFSVLAPTPAMPERWTKSSSPLSRVMNPYPFESSYHLTPTGEEPSSALDEEHQPVDSLDMNPRPAVAPAPRSEGSTRLALTIELRRRVRHPLRGGLIAARNLQPRESVFDAFAFAAKELPCSFRRPWRLPPQGPAWGSPSADR
jgi:hypothetical protein